MQDEETGSFNNAGGRHSATTMKSSRTKSEFLEETSTGAGLEATTGAQVFELEENYDCTIPVSKVVSCLRLVMFGVLVVSAIGTAVAVYWFTRDAEQQAFKASFENDSKKIIDSMGAALFLWLGTIDSYATHAVSIARATNQTWPLVSIPDAAVHMAKLRSLGRGFMMHQTHYITGEQRSEWENYTASHLEWAWKAVRIQPGDKNYDGVLVEDVHSERATTLHDFTGVVQGPGPHLPTWHTSPFVSAVVPYSLDALAYRTLREVMPTMLGEQRAVISRVANLPNDADPISVLETFAATDYAKDFIRKDDEPDEPFSAIFYPIVDTSADHVSLFDEMGKATDNHTTVGVMTMFFFWRDLLRDILAEDSKGIVCVIENPCSQTFTYEIRGGREVKYLGRGDHHEPKYRYMKESLDFEDFVTRSASGRQYTGSPLGGGVCPYTLHVYSSAEREKLFVTNKPVILTVAAVLIFVFTSGVFLIYDACVERRQRKILYEAARSSANVAWLERMVRERTRKLEDANTRLEEANVRVTRASAAQLEHFACMSHEIRTPLNCIIGLSSLLLDTELQPMQEESARMIVTSGDLLLTVVNDVLDYSKLESGNVEINVMRSNLQETLSTVVQAMEIRGQPKKLSIRTRFDPVLGEFAHIDYRRVQQILLNLLSNAIKFSFEGGVIELYVQFVDGSGSNSSAATGTGKAAGAPSLASNDAPVAENENSTCDNVSLPNSDNLIRFVVKDYGRGIEKKDFETIFQPFRQASAETERVYGGTGLGLAVTSKLINSLGGRIEVDSQEGEWAQFTVDLPYLDAPVDISSISKRLGNTTILLVDDECGKVDEISHVFQQCSLNFECFDSMSKLASRLRDGATASPGRSYISVVQERLFDAATYTQLDASASTVLLSYGPKFTVKESKGHFRSLAQVLPSTLLRSFVSLVETMKPLEEPSAKPSTSRQSFTMDINRGMLRILIAEDNKINQKVLVRILKRLHFENVDVVDDGQQACDIELQNSYDVILMDIQMPVMNGIEACKVIMGRNDERPKPKIIFVTAHVADVFAAECRAAGGVDFLPKPLNMGDIENCLQRNTTQPSAAPKADVLSS